MRQTDHSSGVGREFAVKLAAGAGEAPPFAVLELTGTNADGLVTVKQPSAASLSQVAINSGVAIPEGGEGQATEDYPARAVYDSGTGTPAIASPKQTWGTVAGSWKLAKDKAGFRPIGGADGSSAVFEKSGGGTGSGLKISCILQCSGGNLAYFDGCIVPGDAGLILLDNAGNPVGSCSCP